MAAVQRKLVHKQFNSPIGLYSQNNVKETLNRELKAFGSDGIEIDDQISRPLNLASSEVLRAVEEEEQMKCGYKRVAWPPASEERIVREFTPQPQTQYQPAPAYNQQQYQPTAAAANASTAPATQQQYRAPSYDNYQQQQQQQYTPQAQYQNQAPPQASQNLYQPPTQAGPYYQQQQPAWVQQPAAPQQPQQQYQQPPWAQQPQQQQQQYQPQQQQAQYQNPLNQYNQAPHQHHQQQQQQQQQYPLQQNQFVPQSNQQQFNSYSQPQQQQHTVSHDQVDQQLQHYPNHLSQDQRGASPGIITLRKEAPITQKPAPVYTSQPAAISFRESSTDSLGGSNMRGDLKWPPPEYKEAAAKENEERRKLALGPVCRPRKVHRDYTTFFAKNALSHHYPSYKVPPGTQHMIN